MAESGEHLSLSNRQSGRDASDSESWSQNSGATLGERKKKWVTPECNCGGLTLGVAMNFKIFEAVPKFDVAIVSADTVLFAEFPPSTSIDAVNESVTDAIRPLFSRLVSSTVRDPLRNTTTCTVPKSSFGGRRGKDSRVLTLKMTEGPRCLTASRDKDRGWFLQLTAIYFAKAGFATCAIDHQGHGFSDGLIAHIPYINPVVDDCIAFFDEFRSRFDPSLPSFLYSESLGGTIALLITLCCRDSPKNVSSTNRARALIMVSSSSGVKA
ncbi:hypothetical protein Ahy_B03g063852 [Arachis hypogaea]|uniref:Serine aminopeptidase S33 domain-containing protein n=1 Tax=Arachis hypogaea TaxID=3818 RepID=A0A444ZYC1_ARAHY|nr:hypothetical protein Ahy_B03g063852 [Arachis hypogaea]